MVNKFVALSRVAQALGMTLKDICTLNPSYRQQLVNGTAAVPRKIVIPVVNEERQSILRDAIADLSSPIRAPKPIQYVAIATPLQVPSAAIATTANGVAPIIHITKKGDTLANIAAKYNVKIGDLLQWNKTLGTNTTLPLLPGLTVSIGRG
jgi:membrane-bound lytic murein transglycosylase D